MPSQVVAESERPAANVTRIRSYTGVGSHVFVDITSVGEVLAARRAMVWLIARMQTFVVGQAVSKHPRRQKYTVNNKTRPII